MNDRSPFAPAQHPPGVAPTGMAMDEAPGVADWGFGALAAVPDYGLTFFPGFPELALLAQRPEFRKIVETIATEMTRRWIKISSTDDGEGEDSDKSDKIATLSDAMDRLHVRDVFRKAANHDGFFGRGHIFVDLGAGTDDELKTPIGNGRDAASRTKIGKGSLKGLRTVEPLWVYPQTYNTNNPLAPDWYKPQMWLVQGKAVHASRLLTLVGREVPDILKPAYSFGGLSLTQMAKPYVDNWIRTRQSVSDLVHSFSVSGVKTNMETVLQGGAGSDLQNRAAIFNNYRDSRGLMLLDKDTEEFFNVSTPLGTLDKLQAQAQEQMASISSIPLVKLLGITPSGLNASSDGEVRCFYDWIHAFAEHLFGNPLDAIFAMVQLHEFGEVDPDLTYSFEPLWTLNEKEEAEVAQIRANTAQAHIDAGVISPMEERERIAADPDSPYTALDTDDMPALPQEPENDGEQADQGQRGQNQAAGPFAQAHDAGFSESDHPRDGGGKFSAGSVGFSEQHNPDAEEHEFDNEGDGRNYRYDLHHEVDEKRKLINSVVSNLRVAGDKGDFAPAQQALTSLELRKAQRRLQKHVSEAHLSDEVDFENEDRRWNAMTPAQQRAEIKSKEDEVDRAEREHTDSVHRVVDEAVAQGWRPEVNRHGGWRRPETFSPFQSPKSVDKIEARLAHHGIDIEALKQEAQRAA